jgi:hypothetical protein
VAVSLAFAVLEIGGSVAAVGAVLASAMVPLVGSVPRRRSRSRAVPSAGNGSCLQASGPARTLGEVNTLEEVTYQAGRDALADQEGLVAGIRQRTGTLLAAHAIVASFLGATTIRAAGLEPLSWVALGTLVAGLALGAVLLAPWAMKFAVDARTLYSELYGQAAAESEEGTLGWLAAAGFGYQALREENARRVRTMSRCSGLLSMLMIAQTLAWLSALALD